MDDIPQLYEMESLEQLRAIADELRVRIVDLLAVKAMTATMVGKELGIPANKAHYHIRELERVGLVKLVEERVKDGIVEKYYRLIARDLIVPPSLLRAMPMDETLATMGEFFQSFARGFMESLEYNLRSGEMTLVTEVSATHLWMSKEEAKELITQIGALLKPFEDRRGVEGEREHVVVRFTYTPVPTDGEAVEVEAAEDEEDVMGDDFERLARRVPRAPVPPVPPVPPRPPKAPKIPKMPRPPYPASFKGGPKRRRMITAGVVSYSRADLERAVARGELMDIYVIGACIFADDIPADLADQAVARFRIKGTLTASPAVRAVLEGKGERGEE
jgi:DNA-binding transcriptional ArsR family regulator